MEQPSILKTRVMHTATDEHKSSSRVHLKVTPATHVFANVRSSGEVMPYLHAHTLGSSILKGQEVIWANIWISNHNFCIELIEDDEKSVTNSGNESINALHCRNSGMHFHNQSLSFISKSAIHTDRIQQPFKKFKNKELWSYFNEDDYMIRNNDFMQVNKSQNSMNRMGTWNVTKSQFFESENSPSKLINQRTDLKHQQ